MVAVGGGDSAPRVAHPLEVGSRVACQRPDGTTTSVEIIERRSQGAAEDGGVRWSYYVHYDGTDRRLDEWVGEERTVVPDERAGAAEAAAGAIGKRPGAAARQTRNQRRKSDEMNHVAGPANVYDEAMEKEHEESTKVKNVKVVEFGRFEIDAWYFSPYPDDFGEVERLFVCPFSLKYFKRRDAYTRHLASLALPRRRPPGVRIYRAPAPPLSAACLSLQLRQPTHLTCYEVDGSKAKVYCQCLCLLAKLFLDHKTLYYDVDPFLFYVLCEENAEGEEELAGYFSKEKASRAVPAARTRTPAGPSPPSDALPSGALAQASAEGNNIACILVLPQHQRKGYGKLAIDLAYQLTLREGKVRPPQESSEALGDGCRLRG